MSLCDFDTLSDVLHESEIEMEVEEELVGVDDADGDDETDALADDDVDTL